MKLNNVKLKLILAMLFVLVFTGFYTIIYENKKESIDNILKNETKNLKTVYNYILSDFKKVADARAKMIQENDKILNILSKANSASKKEKKALREELYNIAKPMFKVLKSRGVSNLHFSLPGSVSFLRVHTKNKFGDKLSDVRYSYDYVNEVHKQINGLEKGRTNHAYRFVYPIFDAKRKYIGTLDFGYRSNYIQTLLTKSLGIHTHFLISKELFSSELWKNAVLKDHYTQSIEHNDYMFSTTIKNAEEKLKNHHQFIIDQTKDKIKINMDLKKEFALDAIYKNMGYSVLFIPIENIKDNKVVAYLVSYEKHKEIYNIYKNFNYLLIAGFVILLIIFYFIYLNFIHKQSLENEVKKQTSKIQLINNTLEEKIKEAVEKNRLQDKQMINQSRLAQMGEMISMIAHQWRQPLNAISLTSNNLQFKLMMNDIDNDFFTKEIKLIEEYSQHLSTTIEDFRGFFKENKIEEITSLENIINSTLDIVKVSIENKNIKIKTIFESNQEFKTYPNELKQVVLNIIKNSEDALLEKNIQNSLITIKTLYNKEKNTLELIIKDNAKGIPEDIIDNIFDPYFSTKKAKEGTGLGLYMSKTIVENHCLGQLTVSNDKDGAVFVIKLENKNV